MCKPPRHFFAASLQKNIQSSTLVSEKKRGRFYEADTENIRRSGHRGSDRFRLALLGSTVLLGVGVRPCGNGPRHLRCAGADYPSGHKRDHSAGDGVPCQSIWNPDGGGVAARQNTGFAVCDSGSGLLLKKSSWKLMDVERYKSSTLFKSVIKSLCVNEKVDF